MSVLIVVMLFLYGLIFGSFINALVWRLHQQLDDDGNPKKLSAKKKKELSILKGRSMCPSCKHELAALDLIPLFSWIALHGKCRYCKAPISTEYPLVEFVTATVFSLSYIFWPYNLLGADWILFVGYLFAVICLITLAIYDFKWFILPSKLIYWPIMAYLLALLAYSVVAEDFYRFGMSFSAALLFFGLFVSIYLLSALAKRAGKSSKDWLGFGDVRLAFLLGLLVGQPILVFVAMFLASVIGIIAILPSLMQKKLSVTSQVPFGPFLIIGTIITIWFGQKLIDWYAATLLGI